MSTRANVVHNPLVRALVGLASLAAAAVCTTAHADTLVCGPINSDSVWPLSGSPYRLTCDVSLLGGSELTIDPGVIVIFQPNTALVVQDGRLIANGTVSGNIAFKSDDVTNRGAGIRIIPGSGGSASIKYGNFNDLQYGVQLTCCGIAGPYPPAVIEDSTFQNNWVGVQGYAGGSQSQWTQVTRCIFVGNQTGIDTADKTISDCDFYSNTNAISNVERTTIQDCDFGSNVTAISTPGNNYLVDIARCNIFNNVNGIERAPTTRRCTITNNVIGVTITQPVTFECNDVHSNTTYNLKLQLGSSVGLANNWWGTIVPTLIDAGIYDGFDQTGIGFALYNPVLPGSWSTTATCMCTTPSVTLQPLSQTVYSGSTVTFTVAASYVGTPTYQWRHNGVDLPSWSPRFGFSNTASLTINPVARPGSEPTWTDAGGYDCVITNVCGTAISNTAFLTVNICGADYDNNGTVAVPDIFAFLSAWFAGCP